MHRNPRWCHVRTKVLSAGRIVFLFLLQVLLFTGLKPTAAAQTNAIVLENLKPGNPSSQWDISGSGDASIQGFATQISVNKGETVRFKVKTTAAAYRLDI